jgi:membrane protease YdiL (CAAX protease family)
MTEALDWLSVRPTWGGVAALISAMWIIEAGVTGLLMGMSWLGAALPDRPDRGDLSLDKMLSKNLGKALVIIFIVVAIEEAAFRLLPLTLGMSIANGRYVLVFAAVASLAFGLLHLTNHGNVTLFGVTIALLSQGLGGFLMCLLFLKYCGMDARNALGAYALTTAVHFVWNVTVISIYLATGKESVAT